MQKKGAVNLPLHGGHPPKWLFSRMVKLSCAITEVILDEYGPHEFLNRISNVILFSKMLNSNQVKKHANKKRGEEKWKTTVTVVLYTKEKYQIV